MVKASRAKAIDRSGVDKGCGETGTWISFGKRTHGQGRENRRVFLKENNDVRDKLEAALRKNLRLAD